MIHFIFYTFPTAGYWPAVPPRPENFLFFESKESLSTSVSNNVLIILNCSFETQWMTLFEKGIPRVNHWVASNGFDTCQGLRIGYLLVT